MEGTEDEDSFATHTKLFTHWLQQHEVDISPRIKLADLRSRDAGRGVLAIEDIAEDEELFSIPGECLLTIETSDLPEDIKEELEDPWLGLITAMIYEYQRGSASAWAAYFNVLPSDFDTLMFWSDEELTQLAGSAVVNKIGKASADQAFSEHIIPLIKQHADTFNASDINDDDLLLLCHRMGSTIMAYAFDLEKPSSGSADGEDGWEEDEEESDMLPKAMVPLADMLNADADRNNAKLYYEDEKVVMKSICPINAGDEIFNDYGPLPTADVLRRYGYVTKNYAKYDVVEVSSALIGGVAKERLGMSERELENRETYLLSQDAFDTAYDIARPSDHNPDSQQFPDDLIILLQTLLLSQPDFDTLQKKEKLPKPALSASAIRLLHDILQRRAVAYNDVIDPQRLETAKIFQLAHMAGRDAKAYRRAAMAVQVIEGEKAVIREADEALRDMASVPDNHGTVAGTEKRKADGEASNGVASKRPRPG